jgi:hypothetical protein
MEKTSNQIKRRNENTSVKNISMKTDSPAWTILVEWKNWTKQKRKSHQQTV